jgi:hypothetical protein
VISDKHQCIFVHVPKTAGQSIEEFFLDLHGLSWENRAPLLLRQNSDRSKGPQRLAHLTAREYTSLGYIEPEQFDRYFKFSFVRNPWDRLVSEYRFRFEGTITFREFVRRSLAKRDDYSDLTRHVMPQIQFLTDEDGHYALDFVGRFETLEADFIKVADRLGLPRAKLSHRNVSRESPLASFGRKLYYRILGHELKPKTKRRPYQDYYDRNLRERVSAYYAEDIERLSYHFDGSFASQPVV